MLTLNKIQIYSRYNGDIDSWVRNNSREELTALTDEDWCLIDGFIQDLKLVELGLISMEYNNSLKVKLIKNCDSQETINAIIKLARKK
jgi:hypothetical protein